MTQRPTSCTDTHAESAGTANMTLKYRLPMTLDPNCLRGPVPESHALLAAGAIGEASHTDEPTTQRPRRRPSQRR